MKENLPNRKLLRLQHFDYNTPGAYFITICTHDRKCTLAHFVGAIHESPEMRLTAYGKIVENILNNLPAQFNVTIDSYVIMPNHIHLIVVVKNTEEWRAIHESPLRGRSVISRVIGYIKMNASKAIHGRFDDTDIWQRGFHDHVIRNRQDYDRIARYIYENPINWQYDCFYVQG